MIECEFVAKFILARAHSMDVPERGTEDATAKNVMAEAKAIWKLLEDGYGRRLSHDGQKTELFKCDIRGYTGNMA